MEKKKLGTGLGAVLVIASMFTGIGTFFLIMALILVFAEIDDKLKDIIVKTVTFMLAITLFKYIWNLIPDGISVLKGVINDVVNLINSFKESDFIDISDFMKYTLNPISNVVEILDDVIIYLVGFIQVFFAYGIITGKPLKSNPVTNKVNELLTKIINFMNGIVGTPAAAPVAPVAPVAPAQPAAPTNTQVPPTV